MVHRREVDGETLVFGVQGALWGNAMTWWDHQTGSLWSQPIGAAIAGPLKGKELAVLPSSFTSWAAWRSDHPDTTALDGPTHDPGTDIEALAIVAHGQAQLAVVRLDVDVHPLRLGVPHHVGDRLLHGPEGGDLDVRTKPGRLVP